MVESEKVPLSREGCDGTPTGSDNMLPWTIGKVTSLSRMGCGFNSRWEYGVLAHALEINEA